MAHQAFAASADRCWSSRPRRWRTLESMSTGVIGPGGGADEETGEYVLLADRWHTCFFELSGDQGLLGQVEGRTADDAAYWLAQASPAWRRAVQVVAIDMCSIYASAVRQALPHAQLVVDLFHIMQLAVKMTGDVRRRAVREKYGRRGRSGDAGYGVKGLLVRNLEHLRLNQLAKLEARMAYSFRNPVNQRRRVRIACTRTARRSRTITPTRSRQITGRQPDPG